MNLNENVKTLFRDSNGNFKDLIDDQTKQPLTFRDLLLTALRKKTEQTDCEQETLDARFELMEKISVTDEVKFTKIEITEIKKVAAAMFDAMIYGCLLRQLNGDKK